MRIAALVAFVAAGCIGSVSIAAQQPVGGPPPKDNPLGDLFAPKGKASAPRLLFPTPAPTTTRPGDARIGQGPAVVCGLTMIPGDPKVDPGIRHELPADAPRFAIRTVDPRICR